MKRTVSVLVAVLAFGVFASGVFAAGRGDSQSAGRAEIALITDYGTIDDKSFNQGSWEGVVQYATRNNVTHRYFQPLEVSTAAYIDTIDLAVRGGARVVVTPGFLFEPAIFIAQDRYPDVRFILVDGVPRSPEGTVRVSSNVVGVHYAEDQAGFLAGYAAVMDGSRNLGFMGGVAVPAVVRFGYGFVQGAEYAANALNLAAGAVTVRYTYTGTFVGNPQIQTMAAAWYNQGVEVIFACGGSIGNSIMAAAEQANRLVIGVDVDQEAESRTVLTSAMKGLRESVNSLLTDFYANRFPGGTEQTFEASNNGIGLPMATSRFRTFTEAQYNEIFRVLASGTIPRLTTLADGGSPSIVPVSRVRVTEVN